VGTLPSMEKEAAQRTVVDIATGRVNTISVTTCPSPSCPTDDDGSSRCT
jgi:hypothetical protein